MTECDNIFLYTTQRVICMHKNVSFLSWDPKLQFTPISFEKSILVTFMWETPLTAKPSPLPHHPLTLAVIKIGSGTSSVWNLCTRFSDVNSRGNQWWRREMSAVLSGRWTSPSLLLLLLWFLILQMTSVTSALSLPHLAPLINIIPATTHLLMKHLATLLPTRKAPLGSTSKPAKLDPLLDWFRLCCSTSSALVSNVALPVVLKWTTKSIITLPFLWRNLKKKIQSQGRFPHLNSNP